MNMIEKVHYFARKKGVTVKELAKALDINPQLLMLRENSKGNLSLRNITKICNYLSLDLVYFYSFSPTEFEDLSA